MNANELKLIESYLSGEMAKTELAEFNFRLKQDNRLASEVKLHREINAAILQKDVMAFSSKLQAIHQQKRDKNLSSKVIYMFSQNPMKVASIAASFLLLLAVGSFLMFGSGFNKSGDKLFSNYYQADDAIMMVRSGSNPADIDLKEALLAYHEKKYDNAIQLLRNQDNNILAQYYLGLSYLETDNLDKAITTFQHIIDHKFNLFIEQAEWYISLCYLKTSQEEKAKVMLNKISNSESIFKEKAEKILKQI